MNLLELPDLCLLSILDRLPLDDLLHINLACKRFDALYKPALNRRRLLVLIPTYKSTKMSFSDICELFKYSQYSLPLFEYVTGDDGKPFRKCQPQLKYCLLKCPELTLEITAKLVELFTNLNSLMIFQRCAWQYDLRWTSFLLNHWKDLVNLKLWFWSYEYEGYEEGFESWSLKQYFEALFQSVNSLGKLRNLDLNLEVPFYSSEQLTINLPVISQLEKFIFRSVGFERSGSSDVNLPLDSLLSFGESNIALKEIVLQNYPPMGKLLQFTSQFAKQFSELHLDDEVNLTNIADFNRFCYQFTSLRVLSFRVGNNLSLPEVCFPLLDLPALVHLSLVVNCDVPPSANQEQALVNDQLPVEALPRLSSIKALTLFLNTSSHNDLPSLQLHILFPQVQVILLSHGSLRCTLCGYNLNVEQIAQWEAEACMRRGWQALKKCTNLKKVTANLNPISGKDSQQDFDRDEL